MPTSKFILQAVSAVAMLLCGMASIAAYRRGEVDAGRFNLVLAGIGFILLFRNSINDGG